jgi:hypothetical protein
MKRVCLAVFLAGAICSVSAAQNVKVKVRAALYDRDLNLKPIPHLEIKLVPATGAEAVKVQTTLDGVAEAEVPAGKYKVVTDKPVELFDKAYRWEFDVEFAKPENTLELSNDNAKAIPLAGARDARVDELAFQYKRVKDAVVTVWTEHGAYDGAVIDATGLVLTTWRPLEKATWLAVQVDDRRRLAAAMVAGDKEHDIALVRINPSASGALAAAEISADPGALIEGERVFTVEHPNLDKDKKLITGVLSKADASELVADVKIAYGGVLFNSSGNVVGVGRIVDKKTSVLPIAAAMPAITEAKGKLSAKPPSPDPLPTLPLDKFPADSLRAPGRDRWEKDTYSFNIGDFFVEFMTPIALFEAARENYAQELKEYGKHSKGRTPPAEPEYKYEPVLAIAVVPKTKTPFWENMAANSGNRGGPVIRRYKTEFDRMRVLCGGKELTPIWPGHVVAGGGYGRGVVVVDESSMGRYVFTHDALSPQCGKVSLEIYAAKDPEHPLEKVLDDAMVTRLWQDFEPYRKQLAAQGPKAQQ